MFIAPFTNLKTNNYSIDNIFCLECFIYTQWFLVMSPLFFVNSIFPSVEILRWRFIIILTVTSEVLQQIWWHIQMKTILQILPQQLQRSIPLLKHNYKIDICMIQNILSMFTRITYGIFFLIHLWHEKLEVLRRWDKEWTRLRTNMRLWPQPDNRYTCHTRILSLNVTCLIYHIIKCHSINLA